VRELREKRRLQRILYSKITIGALVVVLFFVASATWKVYEKHREVKEKRDTVLNELVELEKQEQDIKKEVARLKTKRGVEEEIRGKFGFVKEGEGVVVIVEPPVQSANEFGEQEGSIFGNVLRSIIGRYYVSGILYECLLFEALVITRA